MRSELYGVLHGVHLVDLRSVHHHGAGILTLHTVIDNSNGSIYSRVLLAEKPRIPQAGLPQNHNNGSDSGSGENVHEVHSGRAVGSGEFQAVLPAGGVLAGNGNILHP